MHSPVKPLPLEDLDDIIARTKGLWEELRGQRIFITGGTGFFGLWLLESFTHANEALNLNASAVVLTRDPAAFHHKAPHLTNRPDLHFLQGDVRTFTFPPGPFPYVIHAATEASARLNAEAPQEMLDTIIGGTRHVLNFAGQCGVRKLLLTSSGAVYGRQPPGLSHVPEDYLGAPDPLLPGSAYGEGKRVSEHLCAVHALHHGYETKIARCFAFVGPHLPLNTHFAIGNFIRDGLSGGPIQIAGDGTPYRSYLYAADLAVWLWAILFRGSSLRAYNVGSSQPLSIREVGGVVGAALGVAVNEPALLPAESPPARYVPSTMRAELELGLSCGCDLRSAIEKTSSWHRGLTN